MIQNEKRNISVIEKFVSKINENSKSFVGLYIDFDNLWASILDIVPEIKKKDEDDKSILNKIIQKLNDTLNQIIKTLEEENMEIKFIKAYSDYTQLLFNDKINIIDILHKKGIKTIHPYVRGNKDMSDRALIIGVIEDIFFSENVDLILVLTGDIDYLPLFEFISSKTEKDFSLISFKNRLNKGYEELFYLKNKILIIDDLLEIDSVELEDEKKFEIFKEFLEEKGLNIDRGIDIKQTRKNLNNYYYCNFEENRIYKLIKRLKND